MTELIEETLMDTPYQYLIDNRDFLDFMDEVNSIYPIRSHQVVALAVILFKRGG